MVMIPLKIFPWLALIAGIYSLATGEADTTASVVMLLVGGIWLGIRFFLKYSNGK